MIYYKHGTGTYIITEPRPWARENRRHFPNYDFANNHPTTKMIENYLIENYNFQKTNYDDSGIVIIQNLNPNLNL